MNDREVLDFVQENPGADVVTLWRRFQLFDLHELGKALKTLTERGLLRMAVLSGRRCYFPKFPTSERKGN